MKDAEDNLKITGDVEVDIIRQLSAIQKQNPGIVDGVLISATARVLGRLIAVASESPEEDRQLIEYVNKVIASSMEQEKERLKNGS